MRVSTEILICYRKFDSMNWTYNYDVELFPVKWRGIFDDIDSDSARSSFKSFLFSNLVIDLNDFARDINSNDALDMIHDAE